VAKTQNTSVVCQIIIMGYELDASACLSFKITQSRIHIRCRHC